MALHVKAGGIEFDPQGGSDVNLLNDYEEGTWTPTIVSSHGTGNGQYTIQKGWYTKVGQFCEAGFWLNLSNVGSMSNYPGITVSTLPFPAKSDQSSGSSLTRGGSCFRNPIANPSANIHTSLMFNNDDPNSANIAYLYSVNGTIAYVTTGIFSGLFSYITST